MKQLFKASGLLLLAGLITLSCNKSAKAPEISDEVMTQIRALGFSTDGVQKSEEGYIVEGDIVLTPEYLSQNPTSPRFRIAEVEQYNTFNLVSVPGTSRTITVSLSGSSSSLSAALDGAIARYNAENLKLQFSRVSSGGNIVIKLVNGGNYIASSGFPTSSGAPYNTVKFNKQYQNYGSGFLTTVLCHEMGHCIGFRHTDYMNRAYSCGGSPVNEGDGGVGAVHIPGTPTGPDAASWMLACLSATTNRPFNSNDKVALNYLY
jgi:hypothetical protein